jgi:CubicO group peptidase (beta-lactamase class C family)
MFTPAWAGDIPTVDPEVVGLSSERLERYSAAMEAGIEAGHFPGAVAAVARNGKIAFFESYGLRDKEAGLPMGDDAIFRIASMTKAITGVAVMMLYEEGHFSLNDPVLKYIPSFKNSRVLVGGVAVPGKSDKSKDKKDWSQADLDQWLEENWETLSDEDKKKWTDYYAANGKGKGKGKTELTETWEDAETVAANRPITIRDLLRHTAGISYAMGDIWEEGDDLGQMIDKLAAQPLKSHPGTRFEYGLSIDVLARLVEVVSGQPFDEFIEERILNPLDMKDTGFYVPKEHATRLVKMPRTESGKKKGKESYSEDSYLSPPVVLAGGSGLVSTTMDYLRFCLMLLNDGELEGERILGRKSIELMRANHMNDVAEKSTGKEMVGEFQFGLTFGVKGKPGDRGELGSEGSYYWGGAYGTTFWIDPKENLVGVFMVNGLNYEKEGYTRPYSQMLEHFTYQAIVD